MGKRDRNEQEVLGEEQQSGKNAWNKGFVGGYGTR